MYEKYLVDHTDYEFPLLKRFSFTGRSVDFNKKLSYLASLADPENWDYKGLADEHPKPVLFYYIVHTFDRCFNQEKIVIKDDEKFAAFNTGLLTTSGNEILAIFEPSRNYVPESNLNYWRLTSFVSEKDRDFLNLCIPKPELATYFNDYNELYFDPTLDIALNFDHIYDDNYDRLPVSLTSLGSKENAEIIFNARIEHTKKMIRRNNRIPVPQFYKEKIMFLIPINVFDDIVVIAIEKIGNRYIANTVLNMGMAYNNARLINRPESNWLLAGSR